MSKASMDNLEKEVGHDFENKNLLRDALTHSSTGRKNNYERLEFLGDRVLGLAVAEILYDRFPDEAEGDLAKRLAVLVQGKMLAQIALKINLGDYIDFSDAERVAGGAENQNILSDVFEAMIGALYLDAGFSKCRELIDSLWEDSFYDMKAPPQHPKTELQEWAQAKALPLPEYNIVKQEGPDHAPVFHVELTVQGHGPVIARASSRQEAEKKAASLFLQQIGQAG